MGVGERKIPGIRPGVDPGSTESLLKEMQPGKERR